MKPRRKRIFMQEIEINMRKYIAYSFPKHWYDFEMLRENCKGLTHSELSEIDERLHYKHNANSKTNSQSIT